MNLDIIIYVILAIVIITWVFWLIKTGLINPDNFKSKQPPNTNEPKDKVITAEIIK